MQPHHQINYTNVNEWTVLTTVTLGSSNCTLSNDGDKTETCCIYFNVNFIILLKQLFCASVSNKTLIFSCVFFFVSGFYATIDNLRSIM